MESGEKITISVYLDDGVVYEYGVATPEAAREHAQAIVMRGYRSCRDGVLTSFGPHRILKVKATGDGITTSYPDRVRGT